MGETTGISWCDATFNPWIGCTKVSVGPHGACELCYAEALSARYGFAQWGNHPRHRTSDANWRKPVAWDRKAAKDGTRPFVFCASLADVFDNQVPPDWRRDLLELIRATPHLTWLLLTKRPQNIVKMFRDFEPMLDGYEMLHWPRNAAIGCTVVTQAEANRDIPHLLAAKIALRPAFAFVSMEPLMEAVDLRYIQTAGSPGWSALWPNNHVGRPWLDWVITGGETDQGGQKARPTPDGAFASLRDQCAAAGVPFHLKQMTRKAPIPADLRIQQRPAVSP